MASERLAAQRPIADIRTSEYYTLVDTYIGGGLRDLDAFLALPSQERARRVAHSQVKAMLEFCAAHVELVN